MVLNLKNMELTRLGQGVRERRKLAHLSLERLSEMTGLKVLFLERLEEGCAPIDSSDLEKVAVVFGFRRRYALDVGQLVDFFINVVREGLPPTLLL